MRKTLAIQMFFEIHKLLHQSVMKKGVKCPLSMPQIATLIFIKSHKKVLIKDVADFMKITNASASVFVKKLEEKEFITRLKNSCDKRAFFLTISEKGQAIIQKAKDKITKGAEPFFEGISDNEIDELVSIFKKILSHKNPSNSL